MKRFRLPGFWVDWPRHNDVVLFSVHASYTLRRLQCWIYIGGFGVGVDL